MANEIQPLQQQGNVAQTANVSAGQITEQATSKLGNILNNFGSSIVDKAGAVLGAQNAQRDMEEQERLIAQGAQGKFNKTNDIVAFFAPSYAKAYDSHVDAIAKPIISSEVNTQISNIANVIKANSDIPNAHKPQVLSEQLNRSLPDILSNIDSGYRTEVGSMAYSQAGQEVSKMATYSADIAIKQQFVDSIGAKDKLSILANKSVNIHEANNYLAQIKQIDDANLKAGVITPLQYKKTQDEYKTNILSQQAINAGITDVAKFASSNGITLTKEMEDSIQLSVDTHYSRQQKEIEIQQIRNHFDMDKFILDTVAGVPTQKPEIMTDEQVIKYEQAQRGSKYLSIAKNVSPESRERLFQSSGFMSLPASTKSLVEAQFREHQDRVSTNPDIAYNLQNSNLQDIGNAFMSNGVKLEDFKKTQRFRVLHNNMQIDPINTIKQIQQEAGQYTPFILNQMDIKNGKSLAIENAIDDPSYLAGLISTEPSRPFKDKEINHDKLSAINSTLPETQQAIQQYIDVKRKGDVTATYDSVFDSKFKVLEINGSKSVVYNNDKDILRNENNIKNISEVVAKKYNITSDKVDDAIRNYGLQLSPKGNAYYIVDSNKQIVGGVPRSYIKTLPTAPTTRDKIVDVLKSTIRIKGINDE